MNKEKQLFITIEYALAALLVVFGHCHPLHGDWPVFLQTCNKFLYIFHIPLFFFIAGVLVSYTSQGRQVGKWFWNKCLKLLCPYVVLNLIAYIPKTLLGAYMNDNMEVSWFNVLKILFIPKQSVWGHFWFIPVYLACTGICALILKLKEKNLTAYKFLGGGCIVIAIVLNIVPIQMPWFGIENIAKHLIYIFIGMFASDYIIMKRKKCFQWWIAVPCFIISIILFHFAYSLLIDRLIAMLMIYTVFTIGIYINEQNRFLQKIGSNAFVIYIWSWPFQAVMEMLLKVVLKAPWFVVYPILFLVGIAGPLLLTEFYKRKIKRNKFLDYLIGVN